MGQRERRITARNRRAQLLVGRIAGAVPGALAGGAVALGAGLPVVAIALLGVVGAVLGAIAGTPDARRAARPTTPPMVEGEHTPPHGISMQP